MTIGIANHLVHVADALRRAIAAEPRYRVVWVAHDGAEAVGLCAKETPDLLLLGLDFPRMDGVEATRQIMEATPCAILIVTVDIAVNSARIFEALGLGALDAVNMPGSDATDAVALRKKIEIISTLLGEFKGAPRAVRGSRDLFDVREDRLVAIGASAGGPAAIAKVLAGLPKDFPAGIVVVQHLDEHFAAGMAHWLSLQSPMPVRTIDEGDRVTAGAVLLAASNDHLTLKAGNRLGYTDIPKEYAYRPSVDVFFQSVNRDWVGQAVGVLLTGMGRDGAAGLKAMRDSGHHTIAQDSASAVYGMPKAAAALHAAVDILALDRVAPRLMELFARRNRLTAIRGDL